jgi:hypothetical protein
VRNLATIAAGVALAAALAGWWRTAPTDTPAAPVGDATLVDASALVAARQLVPRATTPAEQALVRRAMEAADHVLDLGYAQALRDAAERPPPETPETRAAQARLDGAARQLVEDTARLSALRAAAAVTPEENRGAIDSELAIAEAEFEVHQYQFAAANRALTAAGGNLRAQIEALVEQHRTASAAGVELPAVAESPTGLVALAGQAWELRGKRGAVEAARGDVLDAQRRLGERRAALAAEFSDAPESAGSTAAERLASARERATRRQQVAAYDERVAAHGELVQVYDEWLEVAERQAEFVQHRMLRGLALIAGIGLALLLLGRAIGRALERLQLDRRQAEALRTIVTVALQVLGVLLIVFVLFGPPTQLGTVLGLATAGLTVALKDFIVAFFGWFVLMGRNGIRLGDWVEIRGVAGEVVELSVFHTVLLETGNWTDTGHPTGRRVTFTNSYAIEGHYFNFSTSGQWLWDTLSVVVPNGGDLYGFVGTLTDTAKTLTEQSAREAEAEWQRAARTRKLTGLSAEPAVRLKPVVGGTEVSVRYITRADERYRLRSELYAVAVQRLGVAPVPG